MAILDSQTFSGSSNPIGGRWVTMTGLSNLQTVSGNVTSSTGAAFNGAYDSNVVSPNNDQYCKLVWTSRTAGDGGPAIRCSTSADTCYYFDIQNTGNGQLKKHVAGTETAIGTVFLNTTAASGDIMEIRAVGTTISAWQNGTQCASFTDASIASGTMGILFFGTGMNFSAFEGGDFLASASYVGPDFHMKPQAVLLRL